MKSLLRLHLSVLSNLGHICETDTTRDAELLRRRWNEEGDSFLTITLPTFGKALEKGLAEGKWPGHPSFRNGRRGSFPLFMSGFNTRIFGSDGSILDEPDADSIWAIRQLCFLTQKVKRECSPERVSSAFKGFVETDRDMLFNPEQRRVDLFKRMTRRLLGDLFTEADRLIASYELVPNHGPGSVAERISQKEKRNYGYWTDRLEGVFPRWRYTANLPYWDLEERAVDLDEELPVRVISVPKTQSTPRIIAIEPSSVQYAQQGLKRELYRLVESSRLRDIIGFADQGRNRDLAREASVTMALATLDLSEASDRIHSDLVKLLVEDWPHLCDFVFAVRSTRASVPGHGVIPLNKYASMGSALTFPLEAMIFMVLSACAIEQASHLTFSTRQFIGKLSVYGDDIIVPTETVECVIDWLESFGAKVNRSKSFWTGKFRESCGAEFFDGHDVSIERVRHELPSSRTDAAAIAGLADFRNRAYKRGLWRVVRDLDDHLGTMIDLPIASLHSTRADSLLHKKSCLGHRVGRTRWNSELHRDEFLSTTLKARTEKYELDGESGLLEWFHGSELRSDPTDAYSSQERASSFHLKRRWADIGSIR